VIEMTEWKDISTAPKDKMVLVYEDEYGEYYVAQINKYEAWEYASTDMWPKGTFNQRIDFVCMPTHWMALPAPPKKGDE
jgi:hypothetical protein